MTPGKATKELIEHLSNPAVNVIQDCGHMLPIEAPNQCRTLLKEFIFLNNPST
jgi:pimeloyl-ACP methyl ester carboxylesterase